MALKQLSGRRPGGSLEGWNTKTDAGFLMRNCVTQMALHQSKVEALVRSN
jgi:hypothetical protein